MTPTLARSRSALQFHARSGRLSGNVPRALPFPRQQLVKLALRNACDASEHVSEPGLRIDVVELGRHDQGGHDRGAVGSAIGALAPPRFPPQPKAAQGTV